MKKVTQILLNADLLFYNLIPLKRLKQQYAEVAGHALMSVERKRRIGLICQNFL